MNAERDSTLTPNSRRAVSMHDNDLQIVRYTNQHQELWDDFVWRSNNGTLFHSRTFLSYHPPDRFQDESLVIFKGDKLVAVIPAAKLDTAATESVLCSHPGASFGGIVMDRDSSLRDTETIVEAFLSYCRERGFAGVEITLPPLVYLISPNHHLDYALQRNGFRFSKRELTSIIELNPLAVRLLDRFPRETRRAVRRAQKRGVKVSESEAWEVFHQLLRNHMKSRHDVAPTHSCAELRDLHARFPDRVRLFAAFVGSEMVAGMTIFVCNRQVALAFYYVSHRESYQWYHGFNLLFYEVAQWCVDQGLHYLDFGTFTINSIPNWGLAGFKESFGTQGVFRDTLRIEF